MRKHKVLVLALALAITVGFMAGAYAADKAACPAAAKAEKAGKAEKAAGKAAKPRTEVKCEVTGKLDTKMVVNKKTGKEVKAFHVVVAGAKGADGKALDALKGKTLGVGGKKGIKLMDYVGKDVTICGMLVNGKRLVPDSIK